MCSFFLRFSSQLEQREFEAISHVRDSVQMVENAILERDQVGWQKLIMLNILIPVGNHATPEGFRILRETFSSQRMLWSTFYTNHIQSSSFAQETFLRSLQLFRNWTLFGIFDIRLNAVIDEIFSVTACTLDLKVLPRETFSATMTKLLTRVFLSFGS